MTESEYVLMPKRLTAENGAKALLAGEFFESVHIPIPRECDCNNCGICDRANDQEIKGEDSEELRVPVSWTTIKAIYEKAVEHLACTCPTLDGLRVTGSSCPVHGLPQTTWD